MHLGLGVGVSIVFVRHPTTSLPLSGGRHGPWKYLPTIVGFSVASEYIPKGVAYITTKKA